MSGLLDLLYREYCRVRLGEMRKQILLIGSHEVPEANCDTDHADHSADRANDSRGARHEATGLPDLK